jgi:hypothetical protein
MSSESILDQTRRLLEETDQLLVSSKRPRRANEADARRALARAWLA